MNVNLSLRGSVYFIISVLFGYIFGIAFLPGWRKCMFKNANSKADFKVSNTKQKSNLGTRPKVYIGLMSNNEFLQTRIYTLFNTWAPNPMWTIGVYADVNEQVFNRIKNKNVDAKLIKLPGVDDNRYPPQKKSFMMLRHMHDAHDSANTYEWYIRIDDDSYLQWEQLNNIISRLDCNLPYIIGKPGFGVKPSDSMQIGMAYYQGGLGMIFSRRALQEARPHLSSCIRNMLSRHEDIEIGRCIWKKTSARFTVSFETMELFYQSYDAVTRMRSNIETVNEKTLRKAITFHPIKKEPLMFSMHKSVLMLKIQDLIKKIRNCSLNYRRMDNLLKFTLGMENSTKKLKTKNIEMKKDKEVQIKIWDNIFMDNNNWVILRRDSSSYLQAAYSDIIWKMKEYYEQTWTLVNVYMQATVPYKINYIMSFKNNHTKNCSLFKYTVNFKKVHFEEEINILV